MLKKRLLHLAPVVLLFLYSCNLLTLHNQYADPQADLKILPTDSGGTHSPFPLNSTEAPFGFYLYLPEYYNQSADQYPLLIFLHGSGEKGNSATDSSQLDRVLKNGPPKQIENETWSPVFPMLVASPQAVSGWNASEIHSFIEYLMENYRINPERIYISGLSMGGFGTFNYLTTYGNAGYAAAAVPICGRGNSSKVEQCSHIPIWAFHGEEDTTVRPSGSIDFVTAYNAQEPKPLYAAKLTLYPGVTHNSWSRTYDGSGMGQESPDYDAFNISIYNWMFQYKR